MEEPKEKTELKQKNQKEKGITLIALVITIIVLLILAAVSIATLTGENGILTRATDAKEETRYATIKEEKDLWKLSKLTDEQTDSNTAESREEVINRLYDNGMITEEERDTLLAGEAITVADKTISFELTLVDMFELAQTAGCTGEDCSNTNHLHIGDYVDYKAPTTGSHKVETDKSGVDYEQIYNVADNPLKWRVLGIDEETGGLKLIADSPAKQSEETGNGNPYFDIKGAEAYVYAPDEMDAIGALFKNDDAVKGRSVNIDDINQALGMTSDDQIIAKNFLAMQGAIQYKGTYGPFENQYTPESYLNGKTTTNVGGEVTGYAYMIGNDSLPPEYSAMTVNVENTRLRSMLFDNTEAQTGKAYWLASRGVFAYSGDDYATFGPGVVITEDGMAVAGVGSTTFASYGRELDASGRAAVRPVVILKSEITKSDIPIIEDQADSWQS